MLHDGEEQSETQQDSLPPGSVRKLHVYAILHGCSILPLLLFYQLAYGWVLVLAQGSISVVAGLFLLHCMFQRGYLWSRIGILVWDVAVVAYGLYETRPFWGLVPGAGLLMATFGCIKLCGILLLAISWRETTVFLEQGNRTWKKGLMDAFRHTPQAYGDGARQVTWLERWFLTGSCIVLGLGMLLPEYAPWGVQYMGAVITPRRLAVIHFLLQLVYYFILRHVGVAKVNYAAFAQGAMIQLALYSLQYFLLQLMLANTYWFDAGWYYYLARQYFVMMIVAAFPIYSLWNRKTAYYLYCRNDLQINPQTAQEAPAPLVEK